MSSIDNAKCILITGATSGIGRALALALVKLPSRPRIIAAGRRKERLEELSKVEGISTIQLELSGDPNALKQTTQDLIERFPELDAIVLNAGVQYEFDFKKPESIDTDAVLKEINTNYTSNVIFITHILSHFLKLSEQGRPSFIITVSSGLGIVPFRPPVANYSATKAALHSFSLSLRAQLVGTNVNVVDIMPPLVESELHDVQGKTEQLSKHWMSLDQFISTVLDGLRKGAHNIPVGNAKTDYEKFEKGKEDRVAHAALQAAKN